MAFCIPQKNIRQFVEALKNGALNLDALRGLDSTARRAEFAKIFGDSTAFEVNALFEQKLLIEHVQEGLRNWVRSIHKAGDKTFTDILDRIDNLDERILNPESRDQFLEDLAASKLGFRVTMEEAKKIFDKTQEVKTLKDTWERGLEQEILPKDFQQYTSLNPASREAMDSQTRQTLENRLAYGKALNELHDTVEDLRPDPHPLKSAFVNFLGLPKSLATSILHFSAIGVQGWGMISDPIAWNAFMQQFKYFASEGAFQELRAYITSDPDYKFAVNGHLGFTDISTQLTNREEGIQSYWLQIASEWAAKNGVLPGDVIRASGRAFTGFLNYTRFIAFKNLLNASRDMFGDMELNDQRVKDIADVINNATGRAKLGPGDKYGNMQPLLNAVFFAPRKDIATIQMFNPLNWGRLAHNAYLSGDTTAIKFAFRQLTGSIAFTVGLAYLFKSAGYQVNINPLSQDFMKVEAHGEKLDITGGNAIYVRLLARLMANKEIQANGKEVDLGGDGYRPVTRPDLIGQYVEGKLAPVVGAIIDGLSGTNPIGQPATLETEVRSHYLPIWYESGMQYYQDNPDKAVQHIPMFGLMFFGDQLESPLPPPTKNGLTAWGDPENSTWATNNTPTPLDTELKSIDYTMQFPGDTIKGIKLTDKQYQEYSGLSGQLAKQRLSTLVQSPAWQSMSHTQKLNLVKATVTNSRRIAQSRVEAMSVGGSNDIFTKSQQQRNLKLTGTGP